MGGGTLLIPLTTIILHLPQKSAQGLNLLSFLPMAIVSLMVHIKNKLIDFKIGIIIILSGIGFSILSSIIANKIDNSILKKIFGIFLLVIGIYQVICIIMTFIKKDSKTENDTLFKINFWFK